MLIYVFWLDRYTHFSWKPFFHVVFLAASNLPKQLPDLILVNLSCCYFENDYKLNHTF